MYMLAFVQTSRICQHVLGRLDVCPNILKYQDVQTCISKRPEIPGRLDVRLNVLAFQDVYTYFLGCLDAIKISFDVYKFCFCDRDGDDDDGLPAYSHCLREMLHNHNGCTFLQCVFMCVLKLPARDDAQSHWLHLFDFSPVCVFMCVLKLPT